MQLVDLSNEPEVNIIWSDELQGKLHPFFFKKIYRENNNRITSTKYSIFSLGELVTDLKNGVEIRTYSDSGFRYLRVTDINSFGINSDNPRHVEVADIPSKIRLSRHDILISRSGSLGLISEVSEEILDSILSSHIFRV